MKISVIRKYIVITAAVMAVLLIRGAFAADASAADSLTVKAGFYGGPYHTVKTFSYDDMCGLADPDVRTYSGMDTGNFVRVCYAWGVKMDTILNKCDIDMDSVKYLHMSTEDNYGESTTTFSGNILETRYFFPELARQMPAGGQLSSFKSSYSDNAKQVPAILAIGCTDFSRKEAQRIQAGGDYGDYSSSSLSEKYRYRLIYGQESLSGKLSNGYNVQTSGKYVYAVEAQLEGSPAIKVTKTLVAGTKNKIGSKYKVNVDVTLPSTYSYLSADTLNSLKKQVLSGIRVSGYDKSILKVTGLGKNSTVGSDGRLLVETIGKGKTKLRFSYSRKEAFGGETTASATEGMSGSGTGSGSKNNGGSGKSSAGNSDPVSKGSSIRIAKDGLASAVERAGKADGDADEWVSFDAQNDVVDFSSDSNHLIKFTGIMSAALLAAGILGEIIVFRRSIRAKKQKQ